MSAIFFKKRHFITYIKFLCFMLSRSLKSDAAIYWKLRLRSFWVSIFFGFCSNQAQCQASARRGANTNTCPKTQHRAVCRAQAVSSAQPINKWQKPVSRQALWGLPAEGQPDLQAARACHRSSGRPASPAGSWIPQSARAWQQASWLTTAEQSRAAQQQQAAQETGALGTSA